LPRERININIGVSTTVVQGREVKLPFPNCKALAEIVQHKDDVQMDLEAYDIMIRGFIEIEVVKDKVIQRGRHEMRSFLNNLLRILLGFFSSTFGVATTAKVIAVDGSSVEVNVSTWGSTNRDVPMACLAPSGTDAYGIVVGSGTTAVLLNQYNLASKIPHGTSSGQLSYGPTTVDDLGLDTSVTPPVYRFRITRSFSNLSGGDININEVGIVAAGFNLSLLTTYYFLIARDVLPTTYIVPNGGSATVAITIEVVVG